MLIMQFKKSIDYFIFKNTTMSKIIFLINNRSKLFYSLQIKSRKDYDDYFEKRVKKQNDDDFKTHIKLLKKELLNANFINFILSYLNVNNYMNFCKLFNIECENKYEFNQQYKDFIISLVKEYIKDYKAFYFENVK